MAQIPLKHFHELHHTATLNFNYKGLRASQVNCCNNHVPIQVCELLQVCLLFRVDCDLNLILSSLIQFVFARVEQLSLVCASETAVLGSGSVGSV